MLDLSYEIIDNSVRNNYVIAKKDHLSETVVYTFDLLSLPEEVQKNTIVVINKGILRKMYAEYLMTILWRQYDTIVFNSDISVEICKFIKSSLDLE